MLRSAVMYRGLAMPPRPATKDRPGPVALPDAACRRSLRRKLLAWFDKNARDLPWRRSLDPYHIWVSEVMLQQTQVSTVGPYYKRFIAAFPDIAALAKATEEDVLRLWEGLGYYRRARQLHQAAGRIVAEHNGRFPREPSAARALPGVGRYTAGAVLSIAFDAREPILEANSVRVLSRLLAYRDDPARAEGRRLLWHFAQQLLPRRRVGALNQSLMELGSQVCMPSGPLCERCPVAIHCPTRAEGLQDMVPLVRKKPPPESVCEAAIVVRRRGKVLVHRRAAGERWAGMWDFPRFKVGAPRGAVMRRQLVDKVRTLTGLVIELGRELTTIEHGVTRFRITLVCHEAKCVSGKVPSNNNAKIRWVRPAEMHQLPLSVTGRKISRLLCTLDSATSPDDKL